MFFVGGLGRREPLDGCAFACCLDSNLDTRWLGTKEKLKMLTEDGDSGLRHISPMTETR